MRRIISITICLCLTFDAGAQVILLARTQVLKLPCKVLKGSRGDYVSGYFNENDSSLYNCRGDFKGTLAGGYAILDNYHCAEQRPTAVRRKTCSIDYLSSITFDRDSTSLNPGARGVLASAAFLLSLDPVCGVKVVGYFPDSSYQKARQLTWDRVNAVIYYLAEKQGIAHNRIHFSYDTTGPVNTVDLLPVTEQGMDNPTQPDKKVKAIK